MGESSTFSRLLKDNGRLSPLRSATLPLVEKHHRQDSLSTPDIGIHSGKGLVGCLGFIHSGVAPFDVDATPDALHIKVLEKQAASFLGVSLDLGCLLLGHLSFQSRALRIPAPSVFPHESVMRLKLGSDRER